MNDSAGIAGAVVGVVVASAAGILWAAAWALSGGNLEVRFTDGVLGTVLRGQSPAEAWGLDARPWMYWATVAALVVALFVFLALLFRVFGSKRWGIESRQRLGSDTESKLASDKDLETLWIPNKPGGRFLLGRTEGRFGGRFGSKLLGSEWRANPNKRKLSRNARRRESDRGAVLIVGPSRSGKSATALTAIRNWHGPVVLSSVKDDLVGPTLAARRRQGEVGVFDPTEYLLRSYACGNAPSAWDDRLRVGWSPLQNAATFVGAGRSARALSDSGPESSGGQNAMWVELAGQLLNGLLFVAAATGSSMRSVVDWVSTQDRPGGGPDGGEGVVYSCLSRLLTDDDPAVVKEARAAEMALRAVWSYEDKIRSSIYTTAMSLVGPWMAPAVAESSTGQSVNLEWLCDGNNSLYLVAPPDDAKRMAPVFGGMINSILEQAFAKVARDGKPIDPPLLVVIDEAGNMPMDRLPEFASTVAGLGVQLVTIWQTIGQVKSLYRDDADTVIANHLTKVIYPGVSDETTLEYLQKLTGEEEVETTVNSADKWRYWAGSVQLQGTRLGLTPMNVIRTMEAGRSLLIHGTLLPAHIRWMPWFEQKALLAGMEWDDGDERGIPTSLGAAVDIDFADDFDPFDVFDDDGDGASSKSYEPLLDQLGM